MKFTVPQFIEQEMKIVGPFTFKQFIYIGAAGAIIFFLYLSGLPWTFFWTISIILALASLALVFVKVDGRSLPVTISNFFIFFQSSKIYLWQKENINVPFQKKFSVETFEKKVSSYEEKLTEKSQLKIIENKINFK